GGPQPQPRETGRGRVHDQRRGAGHAQLRPLLVRFPEGRGLGEARGVGGRYRVDVDAGVKRELLKDFYATLRGWERYDSRPASEGAVTSDYGLTFALGWSFCWESRADARCVGSR